MGSNPFSDHLPSFAAVREDDLKEKYSGARFMILCGFCGGSHPEHSRCEYAPRLANYKYNPRHRRYL